MMTIKENFAYLRYFGVKLTFYKTINTLIKKTKGQLAWKIHDINDDAIEKYLKKICSQTYSDIISQNNREVGETDSLMHYGEKNKEVTLNNVIWTIWWQGEKNAPELVKACIQSMRKYSNGHPVIVLDESNWKNYVDLPEDILALYRDHENDNTQLKKCVMDRTKLSNIVRCQLLYRWGGIWTDATVMFSDIVPETFFSDEWTTLGQDSKWYIGRGKWSTFFMGCHAGNPLMKFVYDMHVEYWRKKKYFVNYLMFDHIIDIAYKDIAGIAVMIDNVRTENKKCLTINRRYNDIVNEQEIKEFLKYQHFHKLSWRWWGAADANMILKSENGQLTWFGYLYQVVCS